MRDLRLNPYAEVDWDAAEAHKAQLHAHTGHPPVEGHSGQDPPAQVIDDYQAAGYSVLALTGHEYAIEETTWPWSDFERDPERLGVVAIQAAELGGSEDGIDCDLLNYFTEVADTTGMSVHEALAAVGEAGGLALFPHPSRYHEDGEWYVEYVREHPHLLGLEVVNAADRYPTDRDRWDDLLERLDGEWPVWGFANDDFHGREAGYSFDRSRNVLFLDELSEDAVRTALVEGRFVYQHFGVEDPPTVAAIRNDTDRGTLTVEARDADEIQWVSDGVVIDRGPELRYRDVDGVGSYVRARLLSGTGGEQEGASETGTQPFLLE